MISLGKFFLAGAAVTAIASVSAFSASAATLNLTGITLDGVTSESVPNCSSATPPNNVPIEFADAGWVAGDCSGTATGSGTFKPFLSLDPTNGSGGGNSSEEEAFNTAGATGGSSRFTIENEDAKYSNATNTNGNTGRTRELKYSELEAIEVGGTDYGQFTFDINETGNLNGSLISLREFDVWLTTDADLGSTPGSDEVGWDGTQFINTAGTRTYTDLTKVWGLDDGGDMEVYLDYLLAGSGQGREDLYLLIEIQKFIDAAAALEALVPGFDALNSFITVRALFGIECSGNAVECNDQSLTLQFGADSGFEEISARTYNPETGCPPGSFNCPEDTSTVPLPAGLPLMLSVIGVGVYMRRKARKTA